MKLKGDFLKQIKKGDIILFLFVVALCLLCFLPKGESEKLKAEIYLDGEIIHSAVLSEIEKEQTVTVGGCEILLQNDGVTFRQSECVDKLCQKRGKLTKNGDSMACVPQRVVVVLSSEKAPDFDSVVY